MQPTTQGDTHGLECPLSLDLSMLHEAFAHLNKFTDAEETLQHELLQEFCEAVSTLALTLKAKDPQLYLHCCRVQYFTQRLTQALSLQQDESITIELAGLFHDIGKLSIHNDVLQKESYLTYQEFQDVKAHAACSAQLLSQIKLLSNAVPMVLHHHERWDGHGYPDRLCGEAIPFGARIVAITDAFEVMTSHRSYQTTRKPEEALTELRRCAGTQFDPVLVDRFCTSMEADLAKHNT